MKNHEKKGGLTFVKKGCNWYDFISSSTSSGMPSNWFSCPREQYKITDNWAFPANQPRRQHIPGRWFQKPSQKKSNITDADITKTSIMWIILRFYKKHDSCLVKYKEAKLLANKCYWHWDIAARKETPLSERYRKKEGVCC